MKKIIGLILGLSLLIVASSYAIRTKNLVTSNIEQVEIYIVQKEDGNWTANLVVRGWVYDEFDVLDQGYIMSKNRKDLPASVRAMLDNFLKHLATEFNKETANENTDTLPPLD